MNTHEHIRRTRVLAMLSLTVGLAAVAMTACGSSGSGGSSPAPTAAPATVPHVTTVTSAPTTTVVVASSTAATTDAPGATQPATAISVTDADVADMEKQLDDIDQLLAGVDADLSQD